MKEMIFAGFGGQGVLTIGLIIAEIAAARGRQVTWLPSYGSAMRGGTANCTVKYGDGFIDNPAPDEPDVLLALNPASFEMFSGQVVSGGLILVDSEMVDPVAGGPTGRRVVGVPAGALAESIGHKKGANIVMVGALVKLMADFSEAEAIEGMNGMFARKGKNAYADLNAKAFKAGYGAV